MTAARTDLTTERRLLTPEDRLRLAAQDLDGLLVLDNCEHVLDAAAVVVGDLLAVASPDVVVLATSRAPLGLVGESVHRLRALPDADALELLETRARAGRASLGWQPDRALELCHRLDNLPLALELAAARLRSMTVEDVLDGLSDRFALLDDALRGLPERHASLWAMVDWSRELLEPSERVLVQRLAVVPAPFTADTAVAVSGAEPADRPARARHPRRAVAAHARRGRRRAGALPDARDGPGVRRGAAGRRRRAARRPWTGWSAGPQRPPSGSARTSSAPGSWSRSTAAPRSRRPSSPPCGGPSTTATRRARSTSRAPCSTSGASAACTSSASSGRCGSCTPTTRPRDARRPCSRAPPPGGRSPTPTG